MSKVSSEIFDKAKNTHLIIALYSEAATIFTGKQLCWSIFLIKLQTFMHTTFSKRDSNTGVFLWINCKIFQNSFLYRTLPFGRLLLYVFGVIYEIFLIIVFSTSLFILFFQIIKCPFNLETLLLSDNVIYSMQAKNFDMSLKST